MRKISIGIVFLLSSFIPAICQYHQQFYVRDRNGNIIPKATVRVCVEPAVGSPCSTLAVIYSDFGQTHQIPNPASADSNGLVSFFGGDPQIHLQINGVGIQQIDLAYANPFLIGVFTVSGTPHEIIASPTAGNVVLSTPQPIDTTSSPTFTNLGLSGHLLFPGTGGGTNGVIQFTNNGALNGTVDTGISRCNFVEIICIGNGQQGDGSGQVIASAYNGQIFEVNSGAGWIGWGTDTFIYRDSANVFDFGNSTPKDKSATLQAATTNMGTSAIVDNGTNNTIQQPNQILVGNTGMFAMSSTAKANGSSPDTSIIRDSAGVVAIGNGTVSNESGTIKAANATITSNATVSGTTTTANLTATGTTTLPFSGGGNQCLQVNNVGQVSVTGSGCGSSTGSGVTSLTGTVNQVNTSASTGNITLSTPQSIANTSDVVFHSITTQVGGSSMNSAGSITIPFLAAPGTPAGGIVWEDSTDFRFHDKNAGGSIGTTVVSSTLASHNFATNISTNGVLGGTQPAFTDISGSANLSQLPGSGVTTINGIGFTLGASGNLGKLNDGNGNSVLTNNAAIGAVDFFTMQNAATANPATITLAASGSDSNININLIPKGTGQAEVFGVPLFSNPMTTLGDIIYENAAPTAARLPGNTTTTKEYLSQTGTGSVSATPAWAQVAFADISGTATKSQLPATTVYTDQSSTWTTGTQDFHQVAHMIPYPVGTFANRPSNCQVGEAYFATDVQYGKNIYGCVSAGLWILQSGGLSPTIARVDSTAQAASIANSSFFSPANAGFYIISGSVTMHTNPTGGGAAVYLSLISNDGTNSFRVGTNYNGTAVPVQYQCSSGLVYIGANQTVTYATTVIGSGANYDIHLVAERVDPNIGNVGFIKQYTAQTSNIPSTIAFAPTVSGFYRVGLYVVDHAAPASGNISPSITFNDGFFSNTNSTLMNNTGISAGNDCNSSVGCFPQNANITSTGSYGLDTGNVWVGSGQNISFQVSFNSVTGSPNYDAYVVVQLVTGNSANTNIISTSDQVGLTTATSIPGCVGTNVAGMYRTSGYIALRTGFTSGSIGMTQNSGFYSSGVVVGPSAGGYWSGSTTEGFTYQGNINFGGAIGWTTGQTCGLLSQTLFNSVVGSPLYDYHVVFERID